MFIVFINILNKLLFLYFYILVTFLSNFVIFVTFIFLYYYLGLFYSYFSCSFYLFISLILL